MTDQPRLEQRLQRGPVRRAGGKGEPQEDPRLPRLEVVGGDPAALDERPDRRHAARADARRLDDRHACRVGALERLDLERRGVAGARSRAHDPARARRHGCVDQGAVRAEVRDDHVDAWLAPQVDAGERAAERGAACGPVVEDDPSVAVDPAERAARAVGERVDAHRVVLGGRARGVDRVVEHDERAEAAALGRGGDADRADDVERPIGRQRGRGPHRAHDDDRPLVGDDEVEQPGRLLQRVRPVGDHDAIGLVEREQPADELDQVGEVVVGQGMGAEPPERDLAGVRDGGELRRDARRPARRARGGRRCRGTPARSSRSAPTESIVPPVVTIATAGAGGVGHGLRR